MKYKGIPTFEKFFEDRDQQDVGPETQQPGTMQVDTDKPDRDSDLERTLEEIIELAKKSLEMREKGLGDLHSQKKGNKESDTTTFGNLVARQSSDSPESKFGQD